MSILHTKVHSLSKSVGVRRLVVAITLIALLPLASVQIAVARNVESLPEKPEDKSEAQKEKESHWPSPDKFIAVDSLPVAIHKETPIYPEEAKNAGIEGSVWVKVLVDRDGTVGRAILAKESEVKAFNDAALEAALKYTYRPAWQKGKRIAIWITYEVKFKLEPKAEE